MAITYSVGSNTITVTGYSEVTPCNFTNLYNADKAGTLSLHDRDGVSVADGVAVAVDRALRPADYVILGGASNDLYITVANWTNMTTASIRITGTDRDGTAQTEDIVVNANGTYYTTNWFKTITHTQVMVFTKSDAGSFDYELIQGQWGIVWNTGNQFRFDCQVTIGDDGTATYFADTNKQIYVSNIEAQISNNEAVFNIRRYASFVIGQVDDVADKITSQGCTFYSAIWRTGYFYYRLIGRNGIAVAHFYNSYFETVSSSGYLEMFYGEYASEPMQMWNCIMSNTRGFFGNYHDIYNLTAFNSSVRGIFTNGIISNLENIKIGKWNLGIRTAGSQVGWYAKNIEFIDVTTEINYRSYTRDCALINCIFSNDPIVIQWQSVFYTGDGRILEQYTFDLEVLDGSNNAIEGATATLNDVDGTEISSDTTDVNGQITQANITAISHENADPDQNGYSTTRNTRTPHTLTITKAGYETYTEKFTLDEKIDWRIALKPARIAVDQEQMWI